MNQAIERATGLALQGDAVAALAVLRPLTTPLDAEDAPFREAMLRRFGSAAPDDDVAVADAWLASLARRFIAYWHAALTQQRPVAEAEDSLRLDLCDVLGLEATADFDAIEAATTAEVERRGYRCLMGRTLPLRELMLWRTSTMREVDVALPEGSQPVTVTYLDDFALRGWGHYATCGRRSASGWATTAGLFAVVPAYPALDDERFAVHFLAHEAQHFADYARFGTLDGWELEYRAKLTEVALADETQAATLTKFEHSRDGSNPALPHAYANDAVLRALENQLGSPLSADSLSNPARRQRVRDAATTLLRDDTQRREPLQG